MGVILVYTIPATGHVYAMLAVIETLVQRGHHVIVYSGLRYREEIVGTGADFIPYPFNENKIDLKDGSRILKFRSLILEYTVEMLPSLLEKAYQQQPSLILHDAAAHWGKRVGETLQIPSVSFCSFISISKIFSITALQYACYFFGSTIKDLNQLLCARKYIRCLKRTFGYKKFGVMDVLLNAQRLNVISYSSLLQTGANRFGKGYFFLGPSAILRKRGVPDDLSFPKDKKKVYISMGTIQNDNPIFYKQLLRQLFETDYQIYLSDGSGVVRVPPAYKDQFVVRLFFNQIQMLENVDLFITVGGANSICESIKAGVPCLMFPQQGEQRICCERVEQLGFGKLAKKKRPLVPQMEEALFLKNNWDAQKASQLTTVYMSTLIQRLEKNMR